MGKQDAKQKEINELEIMLSAREKENHALKARIVALEAENKKLRVNRHP